MCTRKQVTATKITREQHCSNFDIFQSFGSVNYEDYDIEQVTINL